MTATVGTMDRRAGGEVAVADVGAAMRRLGAAAKDAAAELANASTAAKDAALKAAAAAIRDRRPAILAANAEDMALGAKKGRSAAMLDRLKLDDGRVEAMAAGLEGIADLADPIGAVIAEWTRPNGLKISRVRVPLGVIGIIYESRPNVTADAGGLCLKAGNAVILRGGSESFRSSTAIAEALAQGLDAAGLPDGAIQLVPTRDRAAVGAMLTMTEVIDVIVPRGGRSLIERVAAESRVPVLKHLDGLLAGWKPVPHGPRRCVGRIVIGWRDDPTPDRRSSYPARPSLPETASPVDRTGHRRSAVRPVVRHTRRPASR